MTRRDVLLPALAATPKDLKRLIRDVDPEASRHRASPESWCLADVIAHLLDVEERYLARLRRIVEQDNPYEPSLHPNPSVHDLSRPLEELVENFATRRAATITFLSGLDQRDWGRPLVHETAGPTRLRFQVQALVEHDNQHLVQIIGIMNYEL